MGADANDQWSLGEVSYLADRKVVMAEVDAIGTSGNGNVSAVVYDAKCSGVLANSDEIAGELKGFVVGYVLWAKLEAVGATGCTCPGQFEDFRAVVIGGNGNDDIKPDRAELRSGACGGYDVLFERVGLESQFFEYLRQLRVDGLSHLAKCPEGLCQAFGCGVKAVVKGCSGHLAANYHFASDITLDIPAGDEQVAVECLDGGGEVVAELFGSGGQVGRIDRESAKLLDDARSLTCPVEISVYDPVNCVLHVCIIGGVRGIRQEISGGVSVL